MDENNMKSIVSWK